ncbi:MAG: His/Gly/Thr/Pro-type tRNA ligase C-terminal domain-containing protein, partial [Christensenellales bacterium]
VAPWQVHICALRMDNEEVATKANLLYETLTKAGVEVLFDERNVGAGVKFADADLMGMPIRVVVSPKSLANSQVEITLRSTKASEMVAYDDCLAKVQSIIEGEMTKYRG